MSARLAATRRDVRAAVGLRRVRRAADFSATLDAAWDFADPAASEARFRAERGKWPAGSREALEVDTQIARTQSLRAASTSARDARPVGEFAAGAGPRVEVRYLLERGRTFNSAGDKARAAALFREAATRAAADPAEGAAYYHVDALHMLGIATPPAEQLDWNLKALAAAEAATDPRARAWRGSLLHNVGWTWFDRGDPARAIGFWQQRARRARSRGRNGEHTHRAVDAGPRLPRRRPARRCRGDPARRWSSSSTAPARRMATSTRSSPRSRWRAATRSPRSRGQRRRTRC